MRKIPSLLAFFLIPLHTFANIDITANIPSGTYSAPVRITLTPTESGSKTFYSFKPDGYPSDAFLYTGSILLKHSSPLIYFSVVSPTNESKIKQNDYIIEYPSSIGFGTDSVSGSGKTEVAIINQGPESADIGFWQIQSESDAVTIPEGTMIAPWAKRIIHLNYSGNGSIVLRSPDDDEKDILVPSGVSEKTETVAPKKKTVLVKTVPRKIISTRETSPALPSIAPDPMPKTEISPEKSNIEPVPVPISTLPNDEATETTTTAPVPDETVKPAPAASGASTPVITLASSDIGKAVKVSANESGQTGMNPLYLGILFVLSVWMGGIRWVMGRKRS